MLGACAHLLACPCPHLRQGSQFISRLGWPYVVRWLGKMEDGHCGPYGLSLSVDDSYGDGDGVDYSSKLGR